MPFRWLVQKIFTGSMTIRTLKKTNDCMILIRIWFDHNSINPVVKSDKYMLKTKGLYSHCERIQKKIYPNWCRQSIGDQHHFASTCKSIRLVMHHYKIAFVIKFDFTYRQSRICTYKRQKTTKELYYKFKVCCCVPFHRKI